MAGCLDTDTPKLQERVGFLAADELNGRDNNSPGGLAARAFILDEIRDKTVGAIPGETGDDAYLQHFASIKLGKEVIGANILAMVEGSTRPDEYVVVSAHYDGTGTDCHITPDPTDTVCNAATDNATSVGILLGLIDRFAKVPPHRSVIFAFFDAEEDYLVGSEYYVKNPIYPLADHVAIVNFDITGMRLLPSLAGVTYAIGAETGGSGFVGAVDAAYAGSTLDGKLLSAVFGQNRSDHYWFVSRQIPSLFFTDISGRCYHSRGDDISIVDFPKLKQQMDVAYLTVGQIVYEIDGAIVTPTWTAAPTITYADAVQIHDTLAQAMVDLDLFTSSQQATMTNHEATLAAIVADGPAAFDNADALTTGSIANDMVVILSANQCEGFLD